MCGVFFPQPDRKPHRVKQWLTPPVTDPAERARRDEHERAVCDIDAQAFALEERGTHVVCTDEKSGMQAREHAAPALPMKPGLVEHLEFEYIRHGTRCLMANFVVARGTVIAPTIGPTRTEADFAAHIERTIDTDPEAGRVFVVDNFDTHRSVTLVRLVAARCGIDADLGKQYARGILRVMATRTAFLSDPSHRIRFVYTPKRASWLNQVEIWFSLLVRRLLKRSSFTSLENLDERLRAYIQYYNATLAKPYKWTYRGRPLQGTP